MVSFTFFLLTADDEDFEMNDDDAGSVSSESSVSTRSSRHGPVDNAHWLKERLEMLRDTVPAVTCWSAKHRTVLRQVFKDVKEVFSDGNPYVDSNAVLALCNAKLELCDCGEDSPGQTAQSLTDFLHDLLYNFAENFPAGSLKTL